MNQASVHEFRGKAMNPDPATKESEIAERIEEWVADIMMLKRIDKATEKLPDGYFLSALRRILCGKIKEAWISCALRRRNLQCRKCWDW